MALVNASILILGSSMIAIPIVLHLLMRQKPKHLIFPALRFVQQRRETNQRRLRLRHWLLLLLRCLAIVTLAAALAKPTVASNLAGAWLTLGGIGVSGFIVALVLVAALFAMRPVHRVLVGILSGLLLLHMAVGAGLLVRTLQQGQDVVIGDKQAPVAAILVFDTSPRMQYRQANQTRLQQAMEIADWLVRQLPADSQVAVADLASSELYFSVDVSAAKKRIKTLETTFSAEPLVSVVQRAFEFAATSDLPQKEVYVFSDLAETAWSDGQTARLKRVLDQATDTSLYLIDVGATDPQNYTLGDLRLASESITATGQLQLQTELIRLGPAGTRTIQLFLEKPDPRLPLRRDGQTVVPDQYWQRSATLEVDEQGVAPVQFNLGSLPRGVHHGRIELVGQDGLAIDDRRYFTLEVREPWKVLVVHPPPVRPTNLVEAIAPHNFRVTGKALFDCTTILQNDLSTKRLDEFDAVFLLDPQPLSEATWSLLAEYVRSGGGLAVFLGHQAGPSGAASDSFNSEAAQQLLPGQLADLWRNSNNQLFLNPHNWNHPIMAPFRSRASSVPWNLFPIHRHWGLTFDASDLQTQLDVILTYTNNIPAVVEKRVGLGRVITMTTPITDPARPEGRRRWNDLPLGECWPTWLLMKQISEHLVAVDSTRLNYLTGQSVSLPADPDRDPEEFRLFTPRNEDPQRITTVQNEIRFRFTETPGNYRLKGNRNGVILKGFSINLPVQASQMTKISSEELDELLGKDRYQLAQTPEEIVRQQGALRVGHEFYPLLISMLTVILGLEYLLSNRFYRQP